MNSLLKELKLALRKEQVLLLWGLLLFRLSLFGAFFGWFCLFACLLFCFVLVLLYVSSNCCELEDKGIFDVSGILS